MKRSICDVGLFVVGVVGTVMLWSLGSDLMSYVFPFVQGSFEGAGVYNLLNEFVYYVMPWLPIVLVIAVVGRPTWVYRCLPWTASLCLVALLAPWSIVDLRIASGEGALSVTGKLLGSAFRVWLMIMPAWAIDMWLRYRTEDVSQPQRMVTRTECEEESRDVAPILVAAIGTFGCWLVTYLIRDGVLKLPSYRMRDGLTRVLPYVLTWGFTALGLRIARSPRVCRWLPGISLGVSVLSMLYVIPHFTLDRVSWITLMLLTRTLLWLSISAVPMILWAHRRARTLTPVRPCPSRKCHPG